MQKHTSADSSGAQSGPVQQSSQRPRGITQSGSKAHRVVMAAVAGILIFTLGIGVGGGRISLHAAQNQGGLPAQLDYTSVNEVYQKLKTEYDGKLTSEQLLDGMKAGLAESANDPYTEYFTAKQAKEFNDQLNNSFSGIGAELGQDKDKNLIIVSPLNGFPAASAGLKPQDMVISINGQETSGLSVDEAVTKIRGPEGSKVKLQVIRGKTQPLDFEITRQQIQVPTVETKTLDGNVGYMRINTFGSDTGRLAEEAATKFKQQKVSGVVLDLRGNPGGEVDAAIKVASLWLPAGKTIMQEKRDGKVTETYRSTGTLTLKDMKTAVLLNKGSASASEIVAGALHDNDAAHIIGEKSYGKGVVQSLEGLRGGGQLKVTVASWFRPNGQNINHKGIDPDQAVGLSDDEFKAGKDPQQDAALKYVRGQ